MSAKSEINGSVGFAGEQSARNYDRLRAAYIAITTLLLVAATNFWVRKLETNPLTVAQNARVMFTGPRDDADPVYAALPKNDSKNLSILYIGNSQSYAIMDYRAGDLSMITLLSDSLNGGRETEVAQFPVRHGSEPNLRMSEVLVKSVTAVSDSEHRPGVVIIGVVLDGLRVIDARGDIARTAKAPPAAGELTALAERRSEFPLAAPAIKSLLTASPEVEGNLPQSRTNGKQKRIPTAEEVEGKIQDALDNTVALFRKRKSMYGLVVSFYETQRNHLFRVDTSTRRPIPSETYRTNLQLIEITLKYLREHDVHAVIYFAPVRPIEPNPYDPADISRFRQDLSGICSRTGALCLDYSNLIAEEMWTVYQDNEPTGKTGQRDYAHFTGRAHRKVADQLATDLLPHFRTWLSEKRPPAGK